VSAAGDIRLAGISSLANQHRFVDNNDVHTAESVENNRITVAVTLNEYIHNLSVYAINLIMYVMCLSSCHGSVHLAGAYCNT